MCHLSFTFNGVLCFISNGLAFTHEESKKNVVEQQLLNVNLRSQRLGERRLHCGSVDSTKSLTDLSTFFVCSMADCMKVTANDRPLEVIRSHQKSMIDYGCA